MGVGVLLLWDVDHTLIETGGVGRDVFAEAFRRLTGQPLARMPPVAGRTEPDILRAALELHGIADSWWAPADFEAVLAGAYRERMTDLRRRGRALPGASAAIEACAADGQVVQSVLTGNFRAVAVLKLEAFSLTRHLDLDVGAYGSDHELRPRLVAVAQRRAALAYGRHYGRDDTVLIGDTPGDVRTALEGGARLVGVASGGSSVEELRAAGAEVVLPDLTDAIRVREAVAGR
jgi:phosphoglycolate phosphatase-like HAD superfamily hydrolase